MMFIAIGAATLGTPCTSIGLGAACHCLGLTAKGWQRNTLDLMGIRAGLSSRDGLANNSVI